MVTMAWLFQPSSAPPTPPQTCPPSVHRSTTLSATGLSAAAAVRDSRAKASAHPPTCPDAAAALPRTARTNHLRSVAIAISFSIRFEQLLWALVERPAA